MPKVLESPTVRLTDAACFASLVLIELLENKIARDKTALEILSTEQTYVAGLKVLLKVPSFSPSFTQTPIRNIIFLC